MSLDRDRGQRSLSYGRPRSGPPPATQTCQTGSAESERARRTGIPRGRARFRRLACVVAGDPADPSSVPPRQRPARRPSPVTNNGATAAAAAHCRLRGRAASEPLARGVRGPERVAATGPGPGRTVNTRLPTTGVTARPFVRHFLSAVSQFLGDVNGDFLYLKQKCTAGEL